MTPIIRKCGKIEGIYFHWFLKKDKKNEKMSLKNEPKSVVSIASRYWFWNLLFVSALQLLIVLLVIITK